MKSAFGISLAMAMSIFCSAAVLADKPDSPGKSGKKTHHSEDMERDYRHSGYFDDSRKSKIQQYYTGHKSGKCPPGLAKKNNGCLPPGQAKHWQKGERIPDDIEYYDLPHALLHELGRTREGQKIIRVGTDILLIHEATRTVIDAVGDLGDIF